MSRRIDIIPLRLGLVAILECRDVLRCDDPTCPECYSATSIDPPAPVQLALGSLTREQFDAALGLPNEEATA